jgi:hypothetical protein
MYSGRAASGADPDSIYAVRAKALTHNPELRSNSRFDRFQGLGDCDAAKVPEDALRLCGERPDCIGTLGFAETIPLLYFY